MTYNPNAQQRYHPNAQPRPLRVYQVHYISGLPQMPVLIRKISMYVYSNGFLFAGNRFPQLWIPYKSVTDFKLSTGFGSRLSYCQFDAFYEKMIHITYHSAEGLITAKFEMAVAYLMQSSNYRACKDLVAVLKANGIYSQFSLAKPDGANTPPQQDIPALIEKLAELHQKGILTDEEFQSKKAELLKRL